MSLTNWSFFSKISKVPGERVVGSYALDDVKEYAPVYLTGTSEVSFGILQSVS